jgi:hypothetical protein
MLKISLRLSPYLQSAFSVVEVSALSGHETGAVLDWMVARKVRVHSHTGITKATQTHYTMQTALISAWKGSVVHKLWWSYDTFHMPNSMHSLLSSPSDEARAAGLVTQPAKQ